MQKAWGDDSVISQQSREQCCSVLQHPADSEVSSGEIPQTGGLCQMISDPLDLRQSGWDSVTPHLSVNAEQHRPHRDRPIEGRERVEVSTDEGQRKQTETIWCLQMGPFEGLESNTEPIRSYNKATKPAVSAASQAFVLILHRWDNGKPVVCEPRALIRPQQRSPVLFSLTQKKALK